MHITRSADDSGFRKAAGNVRLYAEDMIPLEDPIGVWKLPIKLRPALLTEEIK